jgi:hypothetical protein
LRRRRERDPGFSLAALLLGSLLILALITYLLRTLPT